MKKTKIQLRQPTQNVEFILRNEIEQIVDKLINCKRLVPWLREVLNSNIPVNCQLLVEKLITLNFIQTVGMKKIQYPKVG